APRQLTVDTQAPSLTLTCLSPSYDRKPLVLVTASDSGGLPNGANPTDYPNYQVKINVDGVEAVTATLRNNMALVRLPEQALPQSKTVQATLKDGAGNDGTSNTCTINPQPVPAGEKWKLTGPPQQLSWDPLDGMGMEQTGNVQITHALDLDKSPGTAV